MPTIYLNETELEGYRAFSDKHYRKCGRKAPKAFSVRLRGIGTGLGMDWRVKCPICKAKENITDINSW